MPSIQSKTAKGFLKGLVKGFAQKNGLKYENREFLDSVARFTNLMIRVPAKMTKQNMTGCFRYMGGCAGVRSGKGYCAFSRWGF